MDYCIQNVTVADACMFDSYHKNSKNWETSNNYHICPESQTVWLDNAVILPKIQMDC